MKEIDSRWCLVGDRDVFELKVYKMDGETFVGKLRKVGVGVVPGSGDSAPFPAVKSGEMEEITGSDVEQIAEKAKTRIQELGCKFSSWRK